MLALCEFNTGKAIPLSERYLGETDQTDFTPLMVGEKYLVFGLIFIKNRIDYLVCETGQNPSWVPSSLFKLLDNRIPNNWEICMTQSKQDYSLLFDAFGISSIIGYSFLVNKYVHYVGLLERDPVEVQHFFEEKHRIDEWWSQNN